jgi:hypothetical protein
MSKFADMLSDRGHLDEAVALVEVAEEKMRRIRGSQHPVTNVVARNLAGFRALKATGSTCRSKPSAL